MHLTSANPMPQEVYPAEAFPACFGVNHGLAIDDPETLVPGDHYRLRRNAGPIWRPLGAGGAMPEPRAELTFLSEHGVRCDMRLVERETARLLLPDQPLRVETDYILIRVAWTEARHQPDIAPFVPAALHIA